MIRSPSQINQQAKIAAVASKTAKMWKQTKTAKKFQQSQE
jgi:hypothetical protein